MPLFTLLFLCSLVQAMGQDANQSTLELSPEETVLLQRGFPMLKYSGMTKAEKVSEIKKVLQDDAYTSEWKFYFEALGLLGERDDTDFMIERVDSFVVKRACQIDVSQVAAPLFSLGFLANRQMDKAILVYLKGLISKDFQSKRAELIKECGNVGDFRFDQIIHASMIALAFSASPEAEEILTSISRKKSLAKFDREMKFHARDTLELLRQVRRKGLLNYMKGAASASGGS